MWIVIECRAEKLERAVLTGHHAGKRWVVGTTACQLAIFTVLNDAPRWLKYHAGFAREPTPLHSFMSRRIPLLHVGSHFIAALPLMLAVVVNMLPSFSSDTTASR